MKIGFTETILADLNHELMSTELPFDSFCDVLEKMNNAGFYSVECMNGAIFKACMGSLRENPWERIKKIKEKMPDTKLQMLIQGNKLFGVKSYKDEITEKFIDSFIKCGIEVIRVFDTDNNLGNMKFVVERAKKAGALVSCAICYTQDITNYTELASQIEKMGADYVCIMDNQGLLTPKTVYNVVKEIKSAVSIPIAVRTHSTRGMSSMIYLKSLKAGADIIDTAVVSLSDITSQPTTEDLNSALCEFEYNTGIDKDVIKEINNFFYSLKCEYKEKGLKIIPLLSDNENTNTRHIFKQNNYEPDFEMAKINLGNLAKCDEDVLAYLMFPNEAIKFLEDRKIKEENPVSYKIEII